MRHYEFNISGTGLTYDAGDALAIFSTNGVDRVDEFLNWYGLARDDVISIEKGSVPLPNHFTAGQLFTQARALANAPSAVAMTRVLGSCDAPRAWFIMLQPAPTLATARPAHSLASRL